jgi:ADP-ribose pyrophosphatase
MTDTPKQEGSDPRPALGYLSSEVIHDGRVVHLSIDHVRFPDGSRGQLELIRHKGASAVVPLKGEAEDPDPHVVLIHQYRYAAGGFIYEIPAGIPFDGESWEACARRELEEETGYVAGEFQRLTQIFTTPGFTNEVIHLFLAKGLTPGRIQRDRDEFIEVVELPLSQVLELAREGKIQDGKSLVGILYVDRFLREGGGMGLGVQPPPPSAS